MAWSLLMLQAVSGPVLPPASIAPMTGMRCVPGDDPADVTVCGRRDEPYRLKPLPPGFENARGLPKAETGVLGGKAAVETEQANVGGFTSNRIMVRLKLPF